MELTAWAKTDELVSCLDSLGDHCKNDRGKEANEMVLKIQRNGAQFQEALDSVNEGLNDVYKKKKKSLEATMTQEGVLEDLEKSLKKEIEEIECTIAKNEEIVNWNKHREKLADEKYNDGRADASKGEEQMNDTKWYHFVPVVGWAMKVNSINQGCAQLLTAQSTMEQARSEKEQAQHSLRDASEHKEAAEIKLFKIRKLLKRTKQKKQMLHEEVGQIRDTTVSTLELSGVLKELLVSTASACGKTDDLTKVLARCTMTPRALRSRGTDKKLAAHVKQWEDVRIGMQTIFSGDNTIIFQDVELRTVQRTLLKEILSLFTTLRDAITQVRDVDEMKKCLKKLEAKGASFLDCIRRELESVQSRRDQLRIEMGSAEKDARTFGDQLDDIGVNVGDIYNELRQNRSAMQSKIELEYKLKDIETVAMIANDRHHMFNEIIDNVANAKCLSQSLGFNKQVEHAENTWHEIDHLVKTLSE